MFKKHLNKSLNSGLAYGLGLTLGNIISAWIFDNISMEWLASEGQSRLILGIVLAFSIMGLGGGIGGLIGGFTLETFRRPHRRWGYAWRSAIVTGVWYGILMFPLGLIISLISFYAVNEIQMGSLVTALMIFGAVFGALVGGFLGAFTVGLRRALRVLSVSLLGFALGGAGLGYGLYNYLFSVVAGQVRGGQFLWLGLGIFVFGALGGASLGFIYSYLSSEPAESPALPRGAYSAVWRVILVAVVVLVFVMIFRPVLSQIRQFLTPIEASLSSVFSKETFGVHWSEALNLSQHTDISPPAGNPNLYVGHDDQVAITWEQDLEGGSSDIYYASGARQGTTGNLTWDAPVNISNIVDTLSKGPQIVLDRSGIAHVVWSQDGQILYSQCQGGECTAPVVLSNLVGMACAPESAPDNANDTPALAIDSQDTLMVVWLNQSNILPFATWSATEDAPTEPDGCVLGVGSESGEEFASPRLASGGNGRYALAYSAGSDIYLAEYLGETWQDADGKIGSGNSPQVYIDTQDQTYAAWCDGDQLQFWDGNQVNMVFDKTCASRPEISQDSEGRVHLVWYGETILNVSYQFNPHTILYESIQSEESWSYPAVISVTGGPSQPTLSTGGSGTLHLAWTGYPGDLYYASNTPYYCEGDELTGISRVVHQAAIQAGGRQPGEFIPYCLNQYDNLVFTPNPNPGFSDQTPSLNGAFDHVGDLIESAQYEALYATMWYDKDKNLDSPGSVIAQSVARLYDKLKDDPASYPRGLTVRILLGNPPEFDGQLWYLLEDLRNAGIDKMLDPEIGWRLEVADFAGSFPHSHVKTLIIDGKTVIAAGYNTTYNHFDIDHPSGQGNGRFDLGIQTTGPVAQESLGVFDDLWVGANRRHCSDFHPGADDLWKATCYDLTATGDHVPEVLRYYLPGGDTTAFSMYRSKNNNESDDQIIAALSAAQETIDVIHVNFTMQVICDLNLFFKVCTAQHSMPYLDSMIDAMAQNGTRVRVLIKPYPFEGLESLIAIQTLEDEIISRGVGHLVEVRFIEEDMHPKANLIDGEFLIIGSQNFHYSAFGEGVGLTEYSLGVSDPQAIEDFERVFEYYWEQATKME